MATGNDAKLGELILYVARRAQGDEAFGKTKLNKILFYADFNAYAKTGKSITGQEYAKYPRGPVPPRAESLMQEMATAGALVLARRNYHGYQQEQPVALREPDLASFSGEEISIVDQVISELWGKSGRDVSDLSHEFVGWKVARMGEEIPYETALVDVSPPTADDEAWLASLVGAGR